MRTTFGRVAERALRTEGDAGRGAELFRSQACIACHTYADGQKPKGPHLVDIGKRYKPAELVESILKPSEKIAQGFDTFSFLTTSGQVESMFLRQPLINLRLLTPLATDGAAALCL